MLSAAYSVHKGPQIRHIDYWRAIGVVVPQKGVAMGRRSTKRSQSSSVACQRRQKQCRFCQIIRDSSKQGSRVIYQDESVIALPDIRPAAAVHLLVLSRAHIPNVSTLEANDVQLVRHMLAVGQQLLQDQLTAQQQEQQQGHQQNLGQHQGQLRQQQQQQQQQQQAKMKFGFHKPPFRSVDHLHLHCFILPHKAYRWIQYQSSLNWITAEQLIDELKRKPSKPPVVQQQQQ